MFQDSDTYEEPQGEQDDSYEPPPSQSVFTTTTSSACFPRGDYVGENSSTLPHTCVRIPAGTHARTYSLTPTRLVEAPLIDLCVDESH